MKNKLLAVTSILILASCNLPKMATKSLFNQGDLNRDGYLTFEELWDYRKYDSTSEEKVSEAEVKKDFKDIDTNSDDKISREELRSYISKELKKKKTTSGAGL